MLYLMEVGEDVFEMMKMNLLNEKMNCGSLRCPWGRKETKNMENDCLCANANALGPALCRSKENIIVISG